MIAPLKVIEKRRVTEKIPVEKEFVSQYDPEPIPAETWCELEIKRLQAAGIGAELGRGFVWPKNRRGKQLPAVWVERFFY